MLDAEDGQNKGIKKFLNLVDLKNMIERETRSDMKARNEKTKLNTQSSKPIKNKQLIDAPKEVD